jgi:tripartite-type tricarboxylate transporter receptor subunit TctC
MLLGQQIIVENRPGATGNVASEMVAKSTPDGYTLLMVAGGDIVIAPWLYKALTIKPVDELAPIFNVAEAPQLLLVPASLPVKTVQEFIAYIKANPEKRLCDGKEVPAKTSAVAAAGTTSAPAPAPSPNQPASILATQ